MHLKMSRSEHFWSGQKAEILRLYSSVGGAPQRQILPSLRPEETEGSHERPVDLSVDDDRDSDEQGSTGGETAYKSPRWSGSDLLQIYKLTEENLIWLIFDNVLSLRKWIYD